MRRSRTLLLVGVLASLGGALAVGLRYYRETRTRHPDVAVIEGRVVEIGPKIAGRVQRVVVALDQTVKAGQLLVELEGKDAAARLAQARAKLQATVARHKSARVAVGVADVVSSAELDQAAFGVDVVRAAEASAPQVTEARRRLERARTQVAIARANAEQLGRQIAAAEADVTRDRGDVERLERLYARELVSRQDVDRARVALAGSARKHEAAQRLAATADSQLAEAQGAERAAADAIGPAESELAAARARVAQAVAMSQSASAAPQQLAISQAQAATAAADIAQVATAVARAELEVSYTKIYAPEAGRVTRRRVEEGADVQAGQPLLTLVADDLWVLASFTERQLRDIRPGQPVTIRVDAYPGSVFRGRVDAVGPGAVLPDVGGSRLAGMGQRVPVKILFVEKPDPRFPLAPGMPVASEIPAR